MAPNINSQVDDDIAAKQRAAPPARLSAPGAHPVQTNELTQLDRDIAAKQRAAAPANVAPGAYSAPNAAPGAYSAQRQELSQLDRDIAAKQRAAAPAGVASSAPGAYSAPNAAPASYSAKREELSQLDRDIAAKQRAAGSASVAASAPGAYSAPNAAAPGAYSAQRQELSQLDRDIAAKQRAAAPANAAPSVPGAYSAPNAARGAHSAQHQELSQLDRDIAAKQRAKSPPRPTPSAPGAYSAPPKELSQMDRDIAAKQRAKAPPAGAAAVAPGAYSAPPSELSQMDRDIAAKQRAKASPANVSAMAPGAYSAQRQELSQLDRDIAAKQRAAAPAGVVPVAPGAYSAPPTELSQMDRDIASKQRGKSPPRSTPGAYSAPPKELSQMDRDIAAKQRAKAPPSAAATAPGAYSAQREELSQLDRDIAAKQRAAAPASVAPSAPGAYSAPPNELSQMDRDIAAKQQAKAPPSSAAVAPGAFSAQRQELSQLDRDIAAKQRAAAPAGVVPVAPGAYSAPNAAPGPYAVQREELSQLDRDIAAKQRGAAPPSPAMKNPPAAKLPPAAAMKSPPPESPNMDSGMQAKEREKQLRKEMLGSEHSQKPSPPPFASAAGLPPPSPAKKNPPVPAGMQAKEIEKQRRKEALRQQDMLPTASGHTTASSIYGNSRAGMPGQDNSESYSVNSHSTPSVPPHVEGDLGMGMSAHSASEAEASAHTMPQVGAFSATRFQARTKSSAPSGQDRQGQEEVNHQHDVEAPPVPTQDAHVAAAAPMYDLSQQSAPSYQMPQQPAPSYHLTQQPETAPVMNAPPPQPLDEASLGSIGPADEGDTGGLNLIEATLVVEEMVEATVATPMEFQQDEVMKIREQSAEETAKINMWRTIVSLALLATGIAVTTSTYLLLVEREDQNFRTVYYQFAHTVADAAIEQQSNIRESLRSLEASVSTMAEIAGNGTSPWPYFIVPHFETLGQKFKKTSNAEFIAIQNYVPHELRDSYIDFITPRYEDYVKEAHMEAYGHIDHLNTDTKFYQPFIAQKLPNKSFVPDIDRDFYFARTQQSPPMRKYGPTINNNLIANKVIGDGFAAVLEIHTENVFTPFKPFTNVPPDEHAKMHSNGIEGANNPHSFTFHPVHRVPGNESSDIVAMFACATAWDFSMLNLLPDNVKGMYCVMQNTCNQTVTYRIDGGDATYLGDGELQPKEYQDMSLFVDLNLQQNPKAKETPGHCMYTMTVYPSKDFEGDYKTNTPVIYATVVAGTFVAIGVMLFIYDRTVTKRNEKMIFQAAKTNAILSKFVPDHLRDRIMGFNKRDGDDNSTGPVNLDMSIMDMSKVAFDKDGDKSMAKSASVNRIDKSMEKSKMDASKSVQNHTRR